MSFVIAGRLETLRPITNSGQRHWPTARRFLHVSSASGNMWRACRCIFPELRNETFRLSSCTALSLAVE